MRKIIIAATTVAALAVPAISMANIHVPTSRTSAPFTASYVDVYGTGAQTDCVGTHVVKVGKTADKSFVIDKEHCKLTYPIGSTTGKPGKPDKVFQPNQVLVMSSFGSGWASDANGVAATSLNGIASGNGAGFSITTEYPLS